MALLLHVPVLHEGYIELFRRRKNEKKLYILGEELISEFPLLAREIRQISPNVIASLIKSLGIFGEVVITGPKQLQSLASLKIVSVQEVEIGELIKKYLPGKKIEYDTAFLRWDVKSVHEDQPISPDVELSTKAFDREAISIAIRQATQSADWFRQVGAVLVKDKKILISGFNKRQPTPHAAYSEGDPRGFIEYGADTHLRLTLHAEQDVIAQAATQGISTKGASIYVTTFPCPDCSALIAAAGITSCYFSEGYAQLHGQDIFKLAGVKIIRVS